MNQNERKNRNRLMNQSDAGAESADSSKSVQSGENGDVYVSCKAKYNNKNNTLMICKKASSAHNQNNYVKRY